MILTEIQKILVNLTKQRKPSRQKRQLSVVKPNAPKGQLNNLSGQVSKGQLISFSGLVAKGQLNRFPVRGVSGPSDWPLYRGYIETIVAK